MKDHKSLILFVLLIFLLVAVNAFSQTNNMVEKLRVTFQNFQYEKVIFLSDSIIVNSANLEKKEQLEIYRLKAVSHYAIGQKNHCELALKSLLKADSNYVMQPSINAPKIIQLFNKIKKNYRPVKIENESPTLLDAGKIKKIRKDYLAAASRSVIFPGWGHNYLQREKGTLFMTGSVIMIPLSIYFTAASWHYEQKYLNEVNAQKIKTRFKKFDNTYKARNIVLATYLIYWLYIQYDFLKEKPGSTNEPGILLGLSQNSNQKFQLSLHIAF